MKQLIKWSVPVVALALTLSSANAGTISGSITFTGGVTTDNNGDVGSSTEVLTWTGNGGTGNPSVLTDQGNFGAGLVGTAVAFHAPWTYASGPIMGFWQVGNFTFNLTSSHVVSEVAGVGVLVAGTGMITDAADGFTPTLATWTFSASDPSAGTAGNGAPVFSIQAASGALVPDGGTTVMMLGAALTGLGLLKRKLTA